jgi:hypothetical protein
MNGAERRDIMTIPTLTSEDYPTAAEMIAMGHRFENGQWTSDAMKAHFAAKAAKEDAVKAKRAAEMADPDYVAF